MYVNVADVAEEVVAACCSLVLAAGLGAVTVLNKRKKRKHSTCVKPYIRERESFGTYNALLLELAIDERRDQVCLFSVYEWTLQLLRNYFCTLRS